MHPEPPSSQVPTSATVRLFVAVPMTLPPTLTVRLTVFSPLDEYLCEKLWQLLKRGLQVCT